LYVFDSDLADFEPKMGLLFVVGGDVGITICSGGEVGGAVVAGGGGGGAGETGSVSIVGTRVGLVVFPGETGSGNTEALGIKETVGSVLGGASSSTVGLNVFCGLFVGIAIGL